ncbi:MAG: hypothetical protein AB7H97_09865, partial [Pseudobdellovibrionaceae bacterium]
DPFKATYTGTDGKKNEITFLAKFEHRSWTFEYVPAGQALSSRDQFISLRTGMLNKRAPHLMAAALVEMQTLKEQLEANPSQVSDAQMGDLLRLSFLLRKSQMETPRHGRVLNAWSLFKSNFRHVELTEQSLAKVVESKKLVDQSGKKIGDPTAQNVEQFTAGKLGNFIKISDGLGTTVQITRLSDGKLNAEIDVLSRIASHEGLVKFLEMFYGLEKIEVKEGASAFDQVQSFKIFAALTDPELSTDRLQKMVSDVSSAQFLYIKNSWMPKIISQERWDRADIVKRMTERLQQAGNLETVEAKLNFVKAVHTEFAAEVNAKNKSAKLNPIVEVEAIGYVREIFKNLSAEEKAELDARAKKAFEDFFNRNDVSLEEEK